MADESKSEPVVVEEEAGNSLEERLPGRDRLLVEIGRSLRDGSPTWADVLLREVELLLRPCPSMGMHRYSTGCECGQSMRVRMNGEAMPVRAGGPAVLSEVQRVLAHSHHDGRGAVLFAELVAMASLPAAAAEGIQAPSDVHCPWCGAQARLNSEFYCPPCGMG